MKFLYEFIIHTVVAVAISATSVAAVDKLTGNQSLPVSDSAKTLTEMNTKVTTNMPELSNLTSAVENSSSAVGSNGSSSPSTDKTTPVFVSTPVVPVITEDNETIIIPVIPTPDTKKTRGFWHVTDAQNVTCILLQSIIEIDVPYNTTANKTEIAHISVPYNAKAEGSCGDKKTETQHLKLTWNATANSNNSLTLQFGRDNKRYFLNYILANISSNSSEFHNVSKHSLPHSLMFKYNETFVKVLLNMSYVCAKQEDIKLSPETGNKTATEIASLRFTELQMQAFHKKITNETHFDEAENCNPFVTPDVVPIIVSCTLAVLVIVVLLAYLIGRRCSQARGYLSM